MELIGLSEFRRDLEIIQRFQKKMISILSCVESQLSTSSQIKKLFDFFEQISIFQHFPLYEAFLRILVHLSIYFNFHETKDEEIISKRQEIFILILKELVLKPSLKTSIHLSTLTLYLIFKSNKQLILFFFKEGIFDTLFLIRTISLFHDSNLFLFFIPEIQKSHPKFYGKLKKQFSFIQEDVNTLYDRLKEKSQEEDSQIKEFEIRRKIHSQEEIAKIIRSDDINNFIEFISRKEKFNLNSKIKSSFLENNPDINNKEEGISILEYSMAFGSINIFRYLWLKEVKYSKETLKYCIIGGNFEILHVLEEESQYKFDKGSYFQSIEYYHPEMTEYFFYSYVSKEISKLQFPLIMTKFNQTTNIEMVCELFLNKSVTQVSQHEKYFSSSKKYTLTFNANKVLDSILNSQQSPFYFLYCFLLQQPNIDINSKHKILIFNFIIIYYFSNGISN